MAQRNTGRIRHSNTMGFISPRTQSYVNKFEELAERAGLTATNPDTTYLFLKGLNASVRSSITKKPIYGYQMARAYALDDVLVTQMTLHLIRSQIPTPPEKQEMPKSEINKQPRAEDYLDEPLAKLGKKDSTSYNEYKFPNGNLRITTTMESNTTSCTSSLSGTNAIKEGNKTSRSSTIGQYNHYQ